MSEDEYVITKGGHAFKKAGHTTKAACILEVRIAQRNGLRAELGRLSKAIEEKRSPEIADIEALDAEIAALEKAVDEKTSLWKILEAAKEEVAT